MTGPLPSRQQKMKVKHTSDTKNAVSYYFILAKSQTPHFRSVFVLISFIMC